LEKRKIIDVASGANFAIASQVRVMRLKKIATAKPTRVSRDKRPGILRWAAGAGWWLYLEPAERKQILPRTGRAN